MIPKLDALCGVQLLAQIAIQTRAEGLCPVLRYINSG